MQIEVFSDQACTVSAGYIDFPTLGDLTLTSGSVNTYTIGDKTVSFLRGAVALQGIVTAPAELYCQYTSNTSKTVYIKASAGQSFVRINVKCGKTSVIDPTFVPANEYRYQCTIEVYNLNGLGTWDSASSGGSNISVDAQYNFYTGLVVSGGKVYLCMFYYTTGNNVHGFFADGQLFNGSIRPKTKSETPTVSPNGHYGTGSAIPGNIDHVNYAARVSRVNTGAHGLRLYAVSATAINALYERLWSRDIWDQWANKKFSPIAGILGIYNMPTTYVKLSDTQKITICGQQYNLGTSVDIVRDGYTEETTYSLADRSDYFKIPEIAGSFVDYSPYCSAVLQLPFIGTFPVNVNAFTAGGIKVVYTFDLVSGNVLAEVYTRDRNGSKILYGQYGGNAAYHYPVTGNDGGGFAVLGAAAGLATAGIAAAVSGGSLAPVAGALVSGSASVLSAEHHTEQAGSLPSNTAALGDRRIILTITRPAYLTPEHYPELTGYPAGDGSTVKKYIDAGGGLIAGTLHADGVNGATEAEKQMIEQAFQGGVYV